MWRHCRRVGGQKQYIFSPLGNKIYFHAKLFHCFSPWPPWKPSILKYSVLNKVQFNKQINKQEKQTNKANEKPYMVWEEWTYTQFSFNSGCDVCQQERTQPCSLHGPRHSRKKKRTAEQSEQRLSAAIESFPDEVELCKSSIPGAGYGVRCKRGIPVGTWIGPFEGKHVTAQEVTSGMDTSYMWEVKFEPVLRLRRFIKHSQTY